MPGAYAACRFGSSGRTCRASACSMGTLLRTEGLAASSMRCSGGVAARIGRMSAARDVGVDTTCAGCGLGSGVWGGRDHRTAVYCEAMLWRSVWGRVLGGVGTCGGRGGGRGGGVGGGTAEE